MRTAYPFLFEDEGTLFSHVKIEKLYACVVYVCIKRISGRNSFKEERM